MSKKTTTNEFLFKPETTTITMDVKDIKRVTEEDLQTGHGREEYNELLLKIYWFFKGMKRNAISKDEGMEELLEEIEEFMYE